MSDELERLKAIKSTYSERLLNIDGVVGVGVGRSRAGDLCIKAYVKKKIPDLEKHIPKQIENWPVELVEVGEIVAY